MRRVLMAGAGLAALAVCALFFSPALRAQAPGCGGVNFTPQSGVTCLIDSSTPTYTATSIGLVPGTAPTDIACLIGSATKTIKVKQIRVSGTAGTAINIVTVITKHASADSGGTPATSTALPVPKPTDSSFAAASATANAWTANPTINDSSPILVSAQTVFLPATGSVAAAGPALFSFDDPTSAPVVIRGIAQEVCVNLNGVTAPSSGLMTVAFKWTEQ